MENTVCLLEAGRDDSARATNDISYPEFDILWNAGNTGIANVGGDTFSNCLWVNYRNIPGIDNQFIQNDLKNIIINDTDANPPTKFIPANYVASKNRMGMLIEKQYNNNSKGYVKIISNNPTIPPKIIGNYLTDDDDLESFKNVIINNVFPVLLDLTSNYFSKLIYPSWYDKLADGITQLKDITPTGNKNKLKNFIKSNIGGHYGGGTCKIGIYSNDPFSVVDQECKVYGINGLRVCDMSIIPITIRWPNINLYPIAEYVADMILKFYNNKKK